MGGDGGSFSGRAEMEKLRPPLVACRIGRLYNKEKVISAMLEKTLPPHMKHIKSLKDMKECEVDLNPATGFPVCPITKADLSSGVRASIIWPCGFIVSNKALEAMTKKDTETGRQQSGSKESGKLNMKGPFVCPMCSKEHDASEDLIPLSPDEEEIPLLLEKALARLQAKKAAKKQKEAKVETAPTADEAVSSQPTSVSRSPSKGDRGQAKDTSPPTSDASETSIVKGVPPKRLRDWVLEFEPGVGTTASKNRKVAA